MGSPWGQGLRVGSSVRISLGGLSSGGLLKAKLQPLLRPGLVRDAGPVAEVHPGGGVLRSGIEDQDLPERVGIDPGFAAGRLWLFGTQAADLAEERGEGWAVVVFAAEVPDRLAEKVGVEVGEVVVPLTGCQRFDLLVGPARVDPGDQVFP